jgi:hypothetical protein
MTPMILAGTMVGLGVTLCVAGLHAPAPDLMAALTRMATPLMPSAQDDGAGPLQRWLDRVTARLAERMRLERFHADLALTGRTPARMAAEKLGYAMVGLFFPLLLTTILTIAGIAVPVVVPAGVGLVLGIGLSFVPELDLQRQAQSDRVQMRRTVCAYLELVALERASDAGAVEALERAAAIGEGNGFAHISDALLRARLEGRTPWQQLSGLAEDLAVPELGDVADIMRLSGEDGAAVLPTLRARAASLRSTLLQAEVTAANEASERMAIPVALLGVAFMALLGFPALHRILFG